MLYPLNSKLTVEYILLLLYFIAGYNKILLKEKNQIIIYLFETTVFEIAARFEVTD